MHLRRLAPVFVLVMVAACGGSDGGGTPNTPTPQTQTRIIRLETNLDFGDVPINTSWDRDLRIYNSGTGPLTVTSLQGPATGFVASWTSGTIPAGGNQLSVVRFTPTEARSYSGTLTVNADHTSGTNTAPITARGTRDIFRRNGTGDSVFDMPLDVARVRIIGTYNGRSGQNFIVRIGGRLIVNEILGTGMTRYDGTLLTGGGVVAITNSFGVVWSFEEVR